MITFIKSRIKSDRGLTSSSAFGINFSKRFVSIYFNSSYTVSHYSCPYPSYSSISLNDDDKLTENVTTLAIMLIKACNNGSAKTVKNGKKNIVTANDMYSNTPLRTGDVSYIVFRSFIMVCNTEMNNWIDIITRLTIILVKSPNALTIIFDVLSSILKNMSSFSSLFYFFFALSFYYDVSSIICPTPPMATEAIVIYDVSTEFIPLIIPTNAPIGLVLKSPHWNN